MRSVAAETAASRGAVQFHFGSHDEFVRHVIGRWAFEVTQALESAAGDSMGLARVASLCRSWIDSKEAFAISVEGTRMEASRAGQDGPSGAFIHALQEWIELTRRALQQARYQKELKPDVQPRQVALELHRLVWSHGWSSAVQGVQQSAGAVLECVFERLAAIAVDPGRSLPERSAFVGPPVDETFIDEFAIPPEVDVRTLPTWRVLLDPDDPWFHAFIRHEIMGDPRSFLVPPDEILPEDVAAAKDYARRRDRGFRGARRAKPSADEPRQEPEQPEP